MKINHGLIAISYNGKNMHIHHFCGYERKPTENDIKALHEELNTDPEFGLVGRMGKDIHVLPAPSEVTKMYTREVRYLKNENNN